MALIPNKRRRHTIVLCALAAGMFAFAFSLVPLYDAFCELTGLNGRTAEGAAELLELTRRAGGVEQARARALALADEAGIVIVIRRWQGPGFDGSEIGLAQRPIRNLPVSARLVLNPPPTDAGGLIDVEPL